MSPQIPPHSARPFGIGSVCPSGRIWRAMFRLLLVLWTLALGVVSAEADEAGSPLPVVTTLPVLKDLVQQIGQPYVRVMSLLSGLESEHSYSPKPSDLVALRKARLLVEIGAGLEVWVAGLIKSAGNPGLTVMTAAEGLHLLDSPEPNKSTASEAAHEGHHHHLGNPHVWLDPDNVSIMVERLAATLMRLDPPHADTYARQAAAYRQTLARTTAELTQQLAPLRDRRIITHHPAWPYFAQRFHLEIVGEIQLQSGAEPSPRHLRTLIERIRRDKIQVIVSEPQLNQKVPRLLADETGARVVVLTPLPGGVPGTDTYLDMLRYNVVQLVQGFTRP